MPIMDGWEFSRALESQERPRPKLIVTTAAEDAERCAREVGADGYLAKPFDLDQLFAVVGADDRVAPI
jgi:CheY-like chemotaxis protein